MGKQYVLIVSCCLNDIWYKDFINSIYEVEAVNSFGLYKLANQPLWIYKKDCLVALPMRENDRDIVFEIYNVGFFELRKAFFKKSKHHIIQSNKTGEQGWVDVICWKSKKKYRHVIKNPNTNYSICRGCCIPLFLKSLILTRN